MKHGRWLAIVGAVVLLLLHTLRQPRPADPSARNEEVQSLVSGFLRKTLGHAIRERNVAAILPLLASDFQGRIPPEAPPLRDPGVTAVRWENGSGSPLDRMTFVTRLFEILENIQVVERVEFRPYEFQTDASERSTVGAYHWSVAGRTIAGRTVELQGDLEVEVVRAPDDSWLIRRLALRRAVRIECDLPPFADITGATGFEFAFDRKGRAAVQLSIDARTNAFIRSLGTVDWNQGDGTFVEDRTHIMARGTAYGMGVSVADYDNEGDWKVYVSNMYSHAGNRIVPLARGLSDPVRKNLLYAVQGNALFERHGGAWREVGVERGVNRADWAWGGIFFDLDNDTDKDIFVVNGFTTHSDPETPDQ